MLAACSPGAAAGPPGATAVPASVEPSPSAATPSAFPSVQPSTAPTSPGGLSLRQRIARMLVVGFRGLDVPSDAWIARAIAEEGIRGVVLFDRDQLTGGDRNVESPEQVRTLVRGLRALAPDRDLIVAIDQEGGIVTRLSPRYGFPNLASEAEIGERGDAAVTDWAAGLAATLADAGIDLNLAPVVDLNVNPSNPAVGALGRAFSSDAAVVARDAGIEIAAHRERGIRTALKHFPGLGSATVNTDFGVADVTATWSDRELDPYRELLGRDLVDVVMAAHVVNGRLDADAPASLSRATVTDLLRGDLGWSGPVITDDLQAAAITNAFGADDAVRLAIEAGCDLLLFANQQAHDPEIATHVIDLVEGLVGDGTIAEARIDASVARVDERFGRGG